MRLNKIHFLNVLFNATWIKILIANTGWMGISQFSKVSESIVRAIIVARPEWPVCDC